MFTPSIDQASGVINCDYVDPTNTGVSVPTATYSPLTTVPLVTRSYTRARQLLVTAAGAALAPQAIDAVEAVDRALLARLSTKVSHAFTAALSQLRQS